MQTTIGEEQEVIVRGSAEFHDYLWHRFGIIKGIVRVVEEHVAISGRLLLLIYVSYIVIEAGARTLVNVTFPPVLDIVMLGLQVLGLEGSVPGLTHLSDDLEYEGRKKDAAKVRFASIIALVLLGLVAVDIVLQKTPYIGDWDTRSLTTSFGNCLLIARVVVVGIYVRAMARIENKGPRIISSMEAKKIEDRDALTLKVAELHAKLAALQHRCEVADEALLQAKSEAEKNASLHTSLLASGAGEVATPPSASPATSGRAKQTRKSASGETQKTSGTVLPMISREQVKQSLSEDESLLAMSEKKIAERLGASASTVHRALEEYRNEHPGVSGEASGEASDEVADEAV